jgi:hypothetical protein
VLVDPLHGDNRCDSISPRGGCSAVADRLSTRWLAPTTAATSDANEQGPDCGGSVVMTASEIWSAGPPDDRPQRDIERDKLAVVDRKLLSKPGLDRLFGGIALLSQEIYNVLATYQSDRVSVLADLFL